MRYAVIENREWTGQGGGSRVESAVVRQGDVEAEARRRKALLGLDEWQVREFVTGTPMPARIRNLCIQIDFAATALSRMSQIPFDYADDVYWPRMF